MEAAFGSNVTVAMRKCYPARVPVCRRSRIRQRSVFLSLGGIEACKSNLFLFPVPFRKDAESAASGGALEAGISSHIAFHDSKGSGRRVALHFEERLGRASGNRKAHRLEEGAVLSVEFGQEM